MAKKTMFFCVILSVLLCNALFAGGGRDSNESRSAQDPSGFTDSVDILNRKTGKHNYYLEARDNAGNRTRSGPENIFVDPASDLPQATIINPMPSMRVQGNMNIVGVAFDDDAVGSVEITIKRGNDGKGEEIVHAVAQGADYWSYFLDTTDTEIWTDGIYTVTAWAIDVKGLSGISSDFRPNQQKKHEVHWILDRKKPDTLVTSHEVGALVAGTVRLRGTAFDGNGIASLKYSTDGGERYTAVRTSFDRRSGNYNWEISLNSKIFDDGPSVIWFQSQDGCGSVGTAAHLLFVNNTGPDVGIVYPEPNATVNGIFSVAGYAQHPVGLKKVTWSAGKSRGEFEMLPGNQWFSTDIDIRSEKISSVDVEFRAEDVSGNVTVKKQRYRVDQNADLPTVTLSQPSSGVNADGLFVVKGTANDDDGVASVSYSLNGGTAVEVPTSGYFQFVVPNPPEGAVTFDIWAKDITGVTGPKTTVRGINVAGALPTTRVTIATTAGSSRSTANFYTGMTLNIDPKARVSLDIAVTGSVTSGTIAFGDNPAVPLRPVSGKATVQIPDNTASGLTTITITTVDRFNREVVYKEYAYIRNTQSPSSQTQDSLLWARAKELPDGRILLSGQGETLLGIDMDGRQLFAAQIRGLGAENFNVSVDGNGRVNLTALREGNFGPLTLTLTRTDSSTYESAAFRILSELQDHTINLTGVPSGWLQTNVPVSFNVSGANRVDAVEYSMDMGETWQSFGDVSGTRPANINVSRTLNVSNFDDGSIMVLVRVTSESGCVSMANFSVLKDTGIPNAALVMPVTDSRVNGTIRIGFSIAEAGKLKSVTYSRAASARGAAITREVYNATSRDKDYEPMYLEVLMDSIQMPLSDNMRFVFEDMAGNRSEVNSWDFVIDQQMDIPTAHVILPLEDEVITTDFIVSGVMFDDDAIAKVYYRVDNTREQSVEAANGFSIPIALSSLTDNEHSLTVTAEDIYGVRSEPVTRNFKVSLQEPSAAMTFPLFDVVLRDSIEFRGTANDKNGVSALHVSMDNGNSFQNVYGQGWRTEGTTGAPRENVNWTYQFNTTILKDGPHVVFMRVWDGYGIPATYASMINIDNTEPEIILDSPGDGSISVGNVSIMGRAIDPNLDSVVIEMRSLDGSQVPAEFRSRQQGAAAIIKDALDVSRLNDGHYNLYIVAQDKAGNVTRISRNFELARQTFRNFVDILYPLDNETTSGEFYLYGRAGGTDKAGTVTIRVNNTDMATADVDDSGYFRFLLNSDVLSYGNNTIAVSSNFGGRQVTLSRTNNIIYNGQGPWVTIDSFNFGDFAYERPYIFGRAGYILSDEDRNLLADRATSRDVKAAINAKTVDFTEISFDNGKTFTRAGLPLNREMTYRYRLETGDMVEGMHFILVRSTMKNGETAVTRMIVQVDKTPPVIRLITPEAGGRYNEEIAYSASATDDVELVSLTYHLRIGDKAAYEIPGFLQGLYIEAIIPPFIKQVANEAPNFFAGGATYMDVGLGLSFFDDNVKIQFQYGFLTEDIWTSMGQRPGTVRYGGQVFGIKLLASIYNLPLASVWGPDFEWLFATFAIGANFSLFDLAQEKQSTGVGYTQSGESTWMSALLLQIEFPKVTIPKREYLRTFSLFTEGQLWFVPTDVPAKANNIQVVQPHIIVGLRLYIF